MQSKCVELHRTGLYKAGLCKLCRYGCAIVLCKALETCADLWSIAEQNRAEQNSAFRRAVQSFAMLRIAAQNCRALSDRCATLHNRFMIAALSLHDRCAIAHYHSVITAKSLRYHRESALRSLCNSFFVLPSSIISQ